MRPRDFLRVASGKHALAVCTARHRQPGTAASFDTGIKYLDFACCLRIHIFSRHDKDTIFTRRPGQTLRAVFFLS